LRTTTLDQHQIGGLVVKTTNMKKKVCNKHLIKSLALAAKFRGTIEKLDVHEKVFTTKAKF
jgi:hypothetical protein